MEMFSFRVVSICSTFSLKYATDSSPSAHTCAAISSARLTNSSDFATKSVSQRSSTIAATLPSRTTATAPSPASLSERLAAEASPWTRNHWVAASLSPFEASRAFFASIMPTPVAWRSACTSLAMIVTLVLLFDSCDDLSVGRRRDRNGRTILSNKAAFGHGVGDQATQQRARTDRVVVAGDHVVDDVGVTVGVHDRHDGQTELARFGDGNVLLLRVDDEDGVGHAL